MRGNPRRRHREAVAASTGTMSMRKTDSNTVLVFGGSFDPPHLAHVAIPREVLVKTRAAALLYVPTPRPPLKPKSPGAAVEHRLAMLRLSLRQFPAARIATDEIERASDEQLNYTIDTLETLRTRLAPSQHLRLLIGTDQMHQFEQWRHWQRIVDIAEPIVMLRAPLTCQAALAPLSDNQRAAWASRLVDVTPMHISSTSIRLMLASGKSMGTVLDPQVERYIRTHGLYGVQPSA